MEESVLDLMSSIDVCFVAHVYTCPEIQEIAESNEGIVSDSLEMAVFCTKSTKRNIIVAGVKFMGETAKILNPDKHVFMLDINATCSLDIGCDFDTLCNIKEENPERKLVVYANTSARIKSIADYIVTSRTAVDTVKYLKNSGHSIIWAPDKHFGNYVQRMTGIDAIIYDGSCIVHENFVANEILELKEIYKGAVILAHPESPEEVLKIADVIGSTTQLIKASIDIQSDTFIVATEVGILYKMEKDSPNKKFVIASNNKHGINCLSCTKCPWMAMNTVDKLRNVINAIGTQKQEEYEVILDKMVIEKARIPLQNMIEGRYL